jgi:hypothetical protein
VSTLSILYRGDLKRIKKGEIIKRGEKRIKGIGKGGHWDTNQGSTT